jgi:hypothetical protein
MRVPSFSGTIRQARTLSAEGNKQPPLDSWQGTAGRRKLAQDPDRIHLFVSEVKPFTTRSSNLQNLRFARGGELGGTYCCSGAIYCYCNYSTVVVQTTAKHIACHSCSRSPARRKQRHIQSFGGSLNGLNNPAMLPFACSSSNLCIIIWHRAALYVLVRRVKRRRTLHGW